jgi:hypothetical protein
MLQYSSALYKFDHPNRRSKEGQCRRNAGRHETATTRILLRHFDRPRLVAPWQACITWLRPCRRNVVCWLLPPFLKMQFYVYG